MKSIGWFLTLLSFFFVILDVSVIAFAPSKHFVVQSPKVISQNRFKYIIPTNSYIDEASNNNNNNLIYRSSTADAASEGGNKKGFFGKVGWVFANQK